MAGNRKLLAEVDRVLKKINEGLEVFDDTWDKVQTASNSSQKEKWEQDLKKEIKKLQRLREQVKTWASSADIRDKSSLLDARRKVEIRMEQFKDLEREMKTKAYSKEGLSKNTQLSAEEQAAEDCKEWLQDMIQQITTQQEAAEADVEGYSTTTKKKTKNADKIKLLEERIGIYQWHTEKLELIIRAIDNDLVDVNDVNDIKEDIEYFVESNQEADFYHDDALYEPLELEEKMAQQGLAVPSVTAAVPPPEEKKKKKKKSGGDDDETESHSSKSSKKTKKKDKNKDKEKTSEADQLLEQQRKRQAILDQQTAVQKAKKEQQNKEREQLRQQELQRAKEMEERAKQEEQLKAQQEFQQQQQQQQQQQAEAEQQQPPTTAAAIVAGAATTAAAVVSGGTGVEEKSVPQLPPPGSSSSGQQQQQQPRMPTPTLTGFPPPGQMPQQQQQQPAPQGQPSPMVSQQQPQQQIPPPPPIEFPSRNRASIPLPALDLRQKNFLLDSSLMHIPDVSDSERPKVYVPKHPFNPPSCFPSNPPTLFETPMLMEKLDTDTLFLIFFHQQGTYQQYLAARELKRQSWRFHKKYRTWFQRHEDPKTKTDEYEVGTYVYFDYESGWCQRIKQDFTFEYAYLEDELQPSNKK